MSKLQNPDIRWEVFDLFNSNQTGSFEAMCRMIFCSEFAKNWNTHSNPNNIGVEIQPTKEQESGKWSSFQSKYMKGSIKWEDIYDSMNKTVKYYKGKLDTVYLFCNQPLNTDRTAYKKAEMILSDAGIELIPCSGEDILNIVRKNDIIKKNFFTEQGYDSFDFMKDIHTNIITLDASHQNRDKDCRKVIELLKKENRLCVAAGPGEGKSEFSVEMALKLKEQSLDHKRDNFVIRAVFDKSISQTLSNLSKKEKEEESVKIENVKEIIRKGTALYNVVLIIDNFDVHMAEKKTTLKAMLQEEALKELLEYDLRLVLFSRGEITGCKNFRLSSLNGEQCIRILRHQIGDEYFKHYDKKSLKEIVKLTRYNPMLTELSGTVMKVNSGIEIPAKICEAVCGILRGKDERKLDTVVSTKKHTDQEMTDIIREFIGMMNLNEEALFVLKLLCAPGPEFSLNMNVAERLTSRLTDGKKKAHVLDSLIDNYALLDKQVYKEEQSDGGGIYTSVKVHMLVTLAIAEKNSLNFRKNAAKACAEIISYEYSEQPEYQRMAMPYLSALLNDSDVSDAVAEKLEEMIADAEEKGSNLSVMLSIGFICGSFGYFEILKKADGIITELFEDMDDDFEDMEPKQIRQAVDACKALAITAGRHGEREQNLEWMKKAVMIAGMLPEDDPKDLEHYLQCRSTYLWTLLKHDDYQEVIQGANTLQKEIDEGCVDGKNLKILSEKAIELRKTLIRDNYAMACGKSEDYDEAISAMSLVNEYFDESASPLRNIQTERAIAYFHIGNNSLKEAKRHLDSCSSKLEHHKHQLSAEKAGVEEANILIGFTEVAALQNKKTKVSIRKALKNENNSRKQINHVYHVSSLGENVVVRKDTSIPHAQLIIAPQRIRGFVIGKEEKAESMKSLLQHVKKLFILNLSDNIDNNDLLQHLPSEEMQTIFIGG